MKKVTSMAVIATVVLGVVAYVLGNSAIEIDFVNDTILACLNCWIPDRTEMVFTNDTILACLNCWIPDRPEATFIA